MRVFVYWNLNRNTYSLKALDGPNKGKVIGYSDSVSLADVTFTVRHAGRMHVVNGGHKQIHAGINGTLLGLESAPADGMRAITYNPRIHTSFVYRDNGAPIASTSRVLCLTTAERRADCYAAGA